MQNLATNLALLAQGTDSAVWEVVIRDLEPSLRPLAARLCPDAVTAEDAIQETLIQIRRDAWQFQVKPGKDADRQALAWVQTILSHSIQAQIRAAIRRAERHRRAQLAQGSPPPARDQLVEAETAGLVRAAVAGLSPEYSQAISLRYFSDLEYAEIAVATGTTEVTVRKRVSRGLATLRQRLGRIGLTLSLLSLIRSLQAQEGSCPSSGSIPSSLFRAEILTMPRILAFGACSAVGLALWVGFSFFHPATTSAAEPQKEGNTLKVEITPPLAKEAAYQALVTGNTTFALALYKHIAANQKGDIVLGPHSISQALALAEAGAAGKTKEEIDQVLGWKPLGEQLHPSWASLSTDLKKVTGVELAIANRLFLQKGAPFLDSYINLCRDHHGASPETCDFLADPEKERVKINAWVGEQTKTRIPELIKPEPQVIKKDTRGVLVNACYFKGQFQIPFEVYSTRKADFYAADGIVPCEMMQNTEAFDHWSDEKTDLIRLPYEAKGKPASAYLTLMVPKSKDGLPTMEKTLGPETLSTAISKATMKLVRLSMPRFTSRTPIELVAPFQSLGVKRAFIEGSADFSAMSREPVFIGAIVHEAWIATDESGSEAAAATAVVMVPKGISPKPSVTLHIDRPFFWFISDAQTGAMLFMGRVTKPQDPGPAKK